MKVVILAGGLGTRLAEETEIKPKPMVEIGGRPILWHIMKHFAHYDAREFYVALGYKGGVIKRYFMEFASLHGSMAIDMASGAVERHDAPHEDWTVNLIETGQSTNTGGRVKRLARYLDDTFLLTYGDGVANVDLHALLDFHRSHGKTVTLSAVRPPSRFGGLVLDGPEVREFTEKPQVGEGWINGGYMVCEPELFDYIEGDATSLESVALERLAEEGKLAAYRHDDFWQCMDTLRDKRTLQAAWESGYPPWRIWE